MRRLQSVVWGLAGLLAFVAMFLRIGVDGAQLGQVLDPTLLLSALGAAVIGRMERLPTITFAAIGLGIVSQAARFHYSSDAYRSVDDRRDHRDGAVGAAVIEPVPAQERGDLDVAGDA